MVDPAERKETVMNKTLTSLILAVLLAVPAAAAARKITEDEIDTRASARCDKHFENLSEPWCECMSCSRISYHDTNACEDSCTTSGKLNQSCKKACVDKAMTKFAVCVAQIQ
jgi:hypothetical protein